MTQTAQVARPRDVDAHHLFTPPGSRTAWEARRRDLREQVLFSAGLWPMPRKTPLRPIVTGRVDEADYTIENVAIETLPGFYLCGNLYRPKGKRGPFPAIVNPHGHWANGRLEVQEDVPPAAPPPAAPADGRGDLVAIGVNLARQGCVVFAYDMAGYNDTSQVSHRFANSLRPWLWGVSLMGLQLWNSIRVVDYLQSLPDVDRTRIGATGASGGGTQTFLLCAVDDRIAAAVPVNMVSAYMQGGCLCENGPALRVGTDNVEIASTFAPKPLLLVCCTGDWTRNVPHEEWPTLKRVYDLYGAGDRTAAVQFNYQHNYNRESREAMYAWFGRWLLGDPNPAHFREHPFEPRVAAMHVWTHAHPVPKDALDEGQLTQALIDRSERQLAAAWPNDAAGAKRFARVYGPALARSLSVPWVPAGPKPASAQPAPTLVVYYAAAEDQAKRVAAEHGGGGVRLCRLDPVPAPGSTLWDAYFSTYNRTPLGDRVAAIVDALAAISAAAHGSRVDIVALGEAGAPALLARAVGGTDGGITVAASGIGLGQPGGPHADAEGRFLADLYAPGLRRAGDVRAATFLAAMRGPVCIEGRAREGALGPALAAARAAGLTVELTPAAR